MLSKLVIHGPRLFFRNLSLLRVQVAAYASYFRVLYLKFRFPTSLAFSDSRYICKKYMYLLSLQIVLSKSRLVASHQFFLYIFFFYRKLFGYRVHALNFNSRQLAGTFSSLFAMNQYICNTSICFGSLLFVQSTICGKHIPVLLCFLVFVFEFVFLLILSFMLFVGQQLLWISIMCSLLLFILLPYVTRKETSFLRLSIACGAIFLFLVFLVLFFIFFSLPFEAICGRCQLQFVVTYQRDAKCLILDLFTAMRSLLSSLFSFYLFIFLFF